MNRLSAGREISVQIFAAVFFISFAGCGDPDVRGGLKLKPERGAFHVRPGDSIQSALEAAADSKTKKVVVHAGVYRPSKPSQALIWLNEKHDGIQLIAEGDVELRGDNPRVAEPDADTFPAIVNHVVYFGDGISNETVLRGFRITGANGFVTREGTDVIQPETGIERLTRENFFYTDGGGIKIFGRSYPRIEEIDVAGNFARPCGGGVSVEHRGFSQRAVQFRDCIFRENGCRVTGSAVDVLPGSSAELTNCLFLRNVANLGTDEVSSQGREYNSEHGSGALTVFPESSVVVRNCTFTDNWNGVDDKGRDNTYENCIFWQNARLGGISPADRYELDIIHAVGVRSCMINGRIPDLRQSIDPKFNQLNAADPIFDDALNPTARVYEGSGYRSTGRHKLTGDVRSTPPAADQY